MAISVENIKSLTDFRRRSKDYVEALQKSKVPMVLTVNGEAAVVVQDAKTFQERQDKLVLLEQELERLKVEALQRDLQKGIDQLESGQYNTFTQETAGELVERIKAQGRSQKETA
jgi:prevent-host-death family protein